MDLELNDKIAVVTGASAGIGRGIAKLLAAEGAQTVIIARRGALLASLQEEITKDGGKRPLAITADLNDRASPARIRDEVLKQLGGVHILVNNAGVSRSLPQDATDEAWDDAFAINFTAVRKLTQAFLPTMQQKEWGRIINITGTMEPHGVGGAIVAKIGVDAWAKGLSRGIAKQGITINSLQPGRIHSEQVDTRLYPTKELQDQYPNHFLGGKRGMPVLWAFPAWRDAVDFRSQRRKLDVRFQFRQRVARPVDLLPPQVRSKKVGPDCAHRRFHRRDTRLGMGWGNFSGQAPSGEVFRGAHRYFGLGQRLPQSVCRSQSFVSEVPGL